MISVEKGYTLKVQQNSKIGNANAAIKISLRLLVTNQTEVAFDGDVKLSGMLAGMGQRLIGGVSNTLTKQFFSNLEKELEQSENNIHPKHLYPNKTSNALITSHCSVRGY